MTVGAKDDNKDRLRVASALQLILCLFSTVNLNGHGDKCKFKKNAVPMYCRSQSKLSKYA